jgi:hypothetical protein
MPVIIDYKKLKKVDDEIKLPNLWLVSLERILGAFELADNMKRTSDSQKQETLNHE